MTNHLRLAGWILPLWLALSSAVALADPPARVGRLAYLENGVDFAVDRNDQGTPATINWPISSGAVLSSDRRGRAEVWVGSTAYRLAGNSRLEFVTVDDRQVTLDLNEGGLAVSVLDRDQVNDVTVHTPDGSVRFVTPGRFRIDVLDDRTELSAQAGQATIDYRGRITPVAAGQKAVMAGAGRVQVEADDDHDAFDNWVADRENATMANTARRHVSPHMTGYQDLDAYGDWRPAPEYGTVWYPRSVADDWAPYRYGRWAWVAPWGWTWIDRSPWGFAPFHYGRWVIIQGRWAWVPGRLVARPVYAPALVGWIGDPGWSVSFSFGSAPAVGWFPLAPREVYVPAYRYSPTYIRQINVSHVREVNVIERAARSGPREAFAHRSTPRAVTVVPANLVREGRVIGAGEIRQPERKDLGRAPPARHAPNPEWLKPAPKMVRTQPDERRESPNWRGEKRDAELPARPMRGERTEPRTEQSPRPAPNARTLESQSVSPAATEPGRDARRELREEQRMERGAPRDSSPSAVRPSDAPDTAPALRGRPPQAVPSPSADPERDARRELRETQRMERAAPRDSAPSAVRTPDAPVTRGQTPQVAVPPASEPGREARRELREAQRMERAAPREQREIQRLERAAPRESAPPVRMAPPSPPPSPPQAMPQAPRAPEASRPPQQQSQPQDQQRGGRDRENPRHGNEREERGPR